MAKMVFHDEKVNVTVLGGGGGGGTSYVALEGPAVPAAWRTFYAQALGRFRAAYPDAVFTDVAFITRQGTAARTVFMASGFAVTSRSNQSVGARGGWRVDAFGAVTAGSAREVTVLDLLQNEEIAWCSTFVAYDGVLLYPAEAYHTCPTCNGSGKKEVWENGKYTGVRIPCPDCGGTGRVAHAAADIAGGNALTYTLDAYTLELRIYVNSGEEE